MIGQRLKLARAGAGLSLRELEERLDNRVTAQALSKYERDEMMPSSGVLKALADTLNVSMSYLLSSEEFQLEDVEFRRADLPAKDLARVEAAVIDRLQRYLTVEEVLAVASIDWDKPREAPFPVNELADAEQAARSMRAFWRLGLDPLPDLAEFLEEKGIKVVALPLPPEVDGLACKVTWREHKRVPVIIVNNDENMSGERERFTLAHELGHLVLGCSADVEGEKAAHRFAGSFLVPVEVLWSEVGKRRASVSVGELRELKKLFGASVHMITYRCRELGIISEEVSRELFSQYKAWGWRKPPYEPDRLETVEPRRFYRLCLRALSEGLISESKGAELLSLTLPQLNAALNPPVQVSH
jgi:Zn-dependent peptidase ImmA (M78 family)